MTHHALEGLGSRCRRRTGASLQMSGSACMTWLARWVGSSVVLAPFVVDGHLTQAASSSQRLRPRPRRRKCGKTLVRFPMPSDSPHELARTQTGKLLEFIKGQPPKFAGSATIIDGRSIRCRKPAVAKRA